MSITKGLPHSLFSLTGEEPLLYSMARSATPNGPIIAVLDGKLVKVDTFVNPQLTIAGAKGVVKAGELVILEAKLTDEVPAFVKSAKIKWVVLENNVEKVCWTDGRKVIFGTGVTNATIHVGARLTLTYQVGVEEVPISCEASADLQVGNPTPTPTPDPSPLTGVAQQVATWAVALVDSETRSKSAKPLGLSFKDVSKTVGTGELTSLRSVLVASKQRNNDAIKASGADPTKWDGWGQALQDLLWQKYNNGEFKNVENIKKCWWEISHGLYNCK